MPRATPPALAHLEGALDALDAKGLRRTRPLPYRGARPSFCSNDYLGLASSPDGFEGPGGAGASRLVSGETDAHVDLERQLASLVRLDAALVYPSGYAANVGLLSALVAPGDLVVSDALNHASIIDGCRLAKASVVVVPHLDVDAVSAALARPASRRWVITESYFGMDADAPDLPALRRVADDHGAGLIVDEAHALGTLGPDGRGRCVAAGIVPDALVGTLGKAYGRQGAFVAGAPVLVEWLWNRSRSFVFSTGLSPALCRSASWAVAHAVAHPELRARCLANADALRASLRVKGLGPIVPLVVGDPSKAVAMAAAARAAGVHVQAIRPPTVPDGTARLRVTGTAVQGPEDVAHACGVLSELLERFT